MRGKENTTMSDQDWMTAINTFLESKRRASAHTERSYRCAMNSFLLFIAPRGPGDVGGADVDEWASELAGSLSPATVAQRLAALSSFYQYCMTTYTDGSGEPLASFNPVAQVERPVVEVYGKSRPLTVEQVRALLGAVDRETVRGLRDYAMILIAVYTGRRSREIRELTRGYIQYNAPGQVRYCWKGKRNKTRWDDLPAPVWDAIQLYWMAAGQDPGLNEPVFISHNGHSGPPRPLSSEFFNRMVQRLAQAAGLPEWVHVHTLRHTASALRLAAGRSVLEINRLLGHASLRTTQLYIEALAGFDDEGWQDVERVLGTAEASMQQRRKSDSSENALSRRAGAGAAHPCGVGRAVMV
jgi:site-specific recombinase XerD